MRQDSRRAIGDAALTIMALALSVLSTATVKGAPSEASRQAWTRAAVIKAFQEVRVVPREGGFIIPPGPFPELVWERPFLVRELWGVADLEVQWFDADAEPVEQATQPGRYAAYVTMAVPNGPTIRRGLTFYCMERDRLGELVFGQPIELPQPKLPGIADEAVAANREAIDALTRRAILEGVVLREEGAILLAGLDEWGISTASPGPLSDPNVRHQVHQLKVKRRVLGVENQYPPLRRPRPAETPAPVLREQPGVVPGLAPTLPDRLREVCTAWLEQGGEPFTLVVAKDGMVVFHEAFGAHRGEPVTRDTAYPMFSISKSVTGVMLASLVDQGLLQLDAPLGEVLPDLPTEGAKAMTPRQCMMHMTGLEGHGRWGALNNPWLDNVIANGMETLQPRSQYSGVGYDLVGTAMALVTGKPAAQLFHEHLFEPLEMKHAQVGKELGSGIHLRAIDLARLGQVILNGGSYGEHVFYGEAVAAELLPQSYKKHFPELDAPRDDYGLGVWWTGGKHPDAGENGVPEDATILSRRTVGHGAFSGSVFRVDLEHRLIVAVGRFGRGKDHAEHLDRLLMTVAEALE